MWFETYEYFVPFDKREKRAEYLQRKRNKEKDIMTDLIQDYLQPRFPDIGFSFKLDENNYYHIYANDVYINKFIKLDTNSHLMEKIDNIIENKEISLDFAQKILMDDTINKLLLLGEKDTSGMITMSEVFRNLFHDKKEGFFERIFKRGK